ncbi:hypothetical protein [Orlajensenia leifsoniae]|uniref:ABC-2 type transport system permease protein n=1 Tax=Orlajensenia leifsoniae TaxID=2561933 RepID=A0A4Y9QQH9_9MICO|nr:hypothetical protein [Leifsonia flava]TFV94859.1 hypothetical protein E4M00_17030 [Leifsonia flava]
MALVLFRLRLALQRGGRDQRGTGGTVWFVAGWVIAVLFGLAGGTLVAIFDSQDTAAGDMIVLLLMTALFLSWILTPVLLPGAGGDAIDPVKLEQFPLSRTEQITGLLIGGLATPTAVATFLVAVGATVAAGYDVLTRIIVLISAVLFVVLCVSTSYAVRALFAAALASRRGRDVAIIVSGLFAVGVFLLVEASTNILRSADAAAGVIGDVLSWTPPGAAGAIGIQMRDGDAGGAALRAVIVVGTVALAIVGWTWALDRHVRGQAGSSDSHRSMNRREDLALVPRLLHGVRSGTALAAMSQHLRYLFFRSPRAVQLITITPLFGIVIGVTQAASNPLTVSMAITTLIIAFGGVTNVFGYDGVGIEATVQSGARLQQVLAGKIVAVVLFLVPLTTGITIAFALVFHHVDEVFVALIASYSTIAIVAAVGAWSSVRSPFNVSSASNRAAQLPRILATLGVALALLILGGIAWAALTVIVPSSIAALTVLLIGIVMAVLSVRGYGRRLDRSPDALLEAVTG